MEINFGMKRVYEKLECSGASELFGMYVLKYPGSEIAYAFVNGEVKTKFYKTLWRGDTVDCLFIISKRESGKLEKVLFGEDSFELYNLLPLLED